jgi:hypothetical protein
MLGCKELSNPQKMAINDPIFSVLLLPMLFSLLAGWWVPAVCYASETFWNDVYGQEPVWCKYFFCTSVYYSDGVTGPHPEPQVLQMLIYMQWALGVFITYSCSLIYLMLPSYLASIPIHKQSNAAPQTYEQIMDVLDAKNE